MIVYSYISERLSRLLPVKLYFSEEDKGGIVHSKNCLHIDYPIILPACSCQNILVWSKVPGSELDQRLSLQIWSGIK